MLHTLPALPYAMDALEPHLSRETIEYHYGKHHRGYVDKLNAILESKPKLLGISLEALIQMEDNDATPLFNNAAQIWNHTFYWHCLGPAQSTQPTGEIVDKIKATWGTLEKFQVAFTEKAIATFASGWVWLVKNNSGNLEIMSTTNANNPMTQGSTPLLTCDVWEHAYYIDYRNARPDYLKNFWPIVNWDFINKQ